MVTVTFAYAHNNQSDALRFRDIVYEILSGNKRYISGKIELIAMPAFDEYHLALFNPDEEGNLIVSVGELKFYHCVSIRFYYPNKESDDPSKSFIEIHYIGDGNEHKVICNNSGLHGAILSKADRSVMTKINKAYDEFEPTELDKGMPECLQTTRLYFPPKDTGKKPRMIDWLKELENRIPEGDPLYEQFHEFKTKALAYRKEKLEDIFTGRNEQTANDYSWLKNLLDPNDLDGDVPNIKGLKDLLDDITKYTFSWAKTGIKDIDENMIKVGTYASTCKSIIEGKSSLHETALKCAYPNCDESKAKLRDLPDPRYLPIADYTRKLIDELTDLLNSSSVIKIKDNTYKVSADTLYNAMSKLILIRNAVNKPDLWTYSQFSAWIHYTLVTLRTELGYAKDVEYKDNKDLCIISKQSIDHMIELINNALNLYR